MHDPKHQRPGELEAEILAEVFGERAGEFEEQRILAKCQAFWPDLAESLAKHSRPVAVKGDRLEVRIEKAVYRQEFQLYSAEILKRVQAMTGARVRRLKMTSGPIDWGEGSAPDADPYRPELRRRPEELNDGQRELLSALDELTQDKDLKQTE